MKKLALVAAALLIPVSGWASLKSNVLDALNPLDAPQIRTNFSQTTSLEWGCPVADRVTASNRAEAIEKIRTECLEEASRAAASKPEVMDVLETKIIYPDVQVLELGEKDAYQLSGTFFVETLVVQRNGAGFR